MRQAAPRAGVRARLFHSRLAGALLTNAWYSLVTRLDRRSEATFLNYGFARDGEALALPPERERDRYAIQLYHHVASPVPLAGRDVLEVGCGRGGGAAYLAAAMRPRRYVGLDVNAAEVAFDRAYHRAENLAFVRGDAHALPFPDGSFDAVLNVESCHHYADLPRFFAEVHRVLRPGGTLLLACFPRRAEPALLEDALRGAPFVCERREDITADVVRALDADSDRREAAIARVCPPPLRAFAREFAGVRGTRLYAFFASGEVPYWSFVLRKGGGAAQEP